MAHREVTMLEVKEVLRLWLAGVPKKRIAAGLGLDVKTVRRYLRAAKGAGLEAGQGERALDDPLLLAVMEQVRPMPGRPHGEGWARCEEHRTFLEGHLSHGVRLSKVRKLLLRQGAQISYPTLRRFAMAELGFGRGAPTILLADCGPGEEVQLDTGWMTLLRPDLRGKRRRFRAWIFTSVLSRHRFVYPVFPETTQTAIEACEAAWEFFGGVFRVLIVDNTKAIVQTADPLAPRITAAFLEYAQARGFVIDTDAGAQAEGQGARGESRPDRARRLLRRRRALGPGAGPNPRAGLVPRRVRPAPPHPTQRLPREHFEAEERAAAAARARRRPTTCRCGPSPRWLATSTPRSRRRSTPCPPDTWARPCAPAPIAPPCASTTAPSWSRPTRACPPANAPRIRSDFPAEKTAYALRDVGYLARKAAEHGPSVGRFAQQLLEGPCPGRACARSMPSSVWPSATAAARLEEACASALAAEMLDVHRLRRMLGDRALTPRLRRRTPSSLLARHLRPASQYTLPLARTRQGEDA